MTVEGEGALVVVDAVGVLAQAGHGRWLEASGVPVAAAWRCQDHVDNESRCYAGHLGLGQDPALAARLRDADVLLVVGARLGDIETAGFTAIAPPGTGRTLIHIHPEPDELGRVYGPTLGIVASGPRFAQALEGLRPVDRGRTDRAVQRGHCRCCEPDFAHLATPEHMGADGPHFRRLRTLRLALAHAVEPFAVLFDETDGLALAAPDRNRGDRRAIAPQCQPVTSRL